MRQHVSLYRKLKRVITCYTSLSPKHILMRALSAYIPYTKEIFRIPIRLTLNAKAISIQKLPSVRIIVTTLEEMRLEFESQQAYKRGEN